VTNAQPYLNNDFRQVGRERGLPQAWGRYGSEVSIHKQPADSVDAIEIRGDAASASGGITQAFPLLGLEGRLLSVSLRARIEAAPGAEAEVWISIHDSDAIPKRSSCHRLQPKGQLTTWYELAPIYVPLEGHAVSIQLGVHGQCRLFLSELKTSIDNEPLETFCKKQWERSRLLFQKHSQRFTSTIAQSHEGGLDLSMLINQSTLTKKRLILFGESSHGSHELQYLRSRLIDALAKNEDFRFVILETSMADMPAINEYLAKGNGDLDKLVRRFIWQGYDSTELRGMLELIRSINKKRSPTKSIVLWGCDCSLPNGAASNVRTNGSGADKTIDADIEYAYNMVNDLGFVSSETIGPQLFPSQWRFDYQKTHAAWLRWIKIERHFSDLEESFEAGGAISKLRWARRNARLVSQGLELSLLSTSNSEHDERDQFMCENVLWILGQQEKHSIGIVCCHNGHASLRRNTLGSLLKRKLDDDIFVIGSTFHSGSYFAKDSSEQKSRGQPYAVLPLCGGNIEEVLRRSADAVTVCDCRGMRKDLVSTGRVSPWMYTRQCGSFVSECEMSAGPVLDWFDMLICVPVSTPALLLPEGRGI
jgi:erythromycin esterase-like protein